MAPINQTDIYTILKNLSIDSGFFRVPRNAFYSPDDVANVLIHASTSSTDSIESASYDLKELYPDFRIPSADTIHGHIKRCHDVKSLLKSFTEINYSLIDCMSIRGTSQIIALDFHTIPYYGNISTRGISGIKPKNGTSWGYSYLTTDIVNFNKQTIDVIPLTGLNKDYSTLIEGVIHRINSQKIYIEKMLMDREFFNCKAIITLNKFDTKFIMPAKYDKRLKVVVKEYEKEYGIVPGILDYKFKDEQCPWFHLVLIPNKHYDSSKKEGKDNKKFYLFATNINYTSTKEFISDVPQQYRIRWNIETGYRMKNIFKIRTCTKSPIVRLFLFLLQCLLHNYLNILKRILVITAYTLKSRIQVELRKFFRSEVNQQAQPSIAVFYNLIKRFNNLRILEFRTHLNLI